MEKTFVSGSPLHQPEGAPEGAFVDLEGERYYRIANHDAMAPFFMSLVSDSDHWLFISSNGALTAGRKDPDHALFPYYTDDRIHDSQEQTGSRTLLRVTRAGQTRLWEPFSQRHEGLYRVSRNLYKHVFGNKLRFEEINHDLGLAFSYEWMSSERFGFVRRSTLRNLGEEPVSVALVDGIQNVLPYGLGRRFQMEYSTLADGYKRTELVEGTGLALFRLSSIPVDKAEPSEALRVNLAWSLGLETPGHLLSTAQLERFRRGETLEPETDVRGRRGAFLLHAGLQLGAKESRQWYIIAELNQDAVCVRALLKRLESPSGLEAELLADVDRGSRNLLRIVASADGLQRTADELSTWRHFSNTLFNLMRGGIPDDGYQVSRSDVQAYFAKSNRDVAARHKAFLEALPESLRHSEFQARAAAQGDPDLERLATEYLPLTFSRRHGDPSRPWNIFSIQVKDEQGRKLLNYQGNWRDIFQNWEALAHAFPGFTEGMIFKFADSSTADGYNPYRLLREGFEWEALDPHDPWSFIGYWGDHQVIYLLKLLEVFEQYQPGQLARLLKQRVFTYADVPYRIQPYEALLANPRSTITFDQAAHDAAMKRTSVLGSDGKTLQDGKGHISRANLTEKLLVVALSKLSNFIPEAGIWMNTQRPEWNDANNALVGYGVSMVTLYYLRRFLSFCRERFEGVEPVEVSQEIADLLAEITGALEQRASLLSGPISDRDRKFLMDALGQAGARYRQRIYQQGFSGAVGEVGAERLREFCDIALRHIDHSIRANRRKDGLYHSYNLMKVAGDGVEVRRLYEMLEGQVAVLSSGALSAEESLALLDALRSSSLYRVDQASYILYPDRALPHFLEKNNLPAAAVAHSELIQALLKGGDTRIVLQDIDGGVHFNAAFRNAELLRSALQELKQGEYASLAAKEENRLLELYETVFDHQSFTGRSGTFYKYEGLGCIYWHMVSKLLLAVDEVQQRAEAGLRPKLQQHYQAIREGLGVHKTPAAYGAIPTDPYSHTPGFAGVQQPGMTGQVKEDFITRFSELGLHIESGRIGFLPALLRKTEFLQTSGTFDYIDLGGNPQSLELEPGSLAFTLCQVPVVVHASKEQRIDLAHTDGSISFYDGLRMDAFYSASIFNREGVIQRMDVCLKLEA